MTAARQATMDKAGVEGCVRVYNDGGRDMLH